MHLRHSIVAALALACVGSPPAHAAVTGVQWTPDSARILVNKDVGADRWSITLNLTDFSATGNIFHTDDRAPSFLWCRKLDDSFDSGQLDLRYECFGADRAIGVFTSPDWVSISDQILLPLSFFIPEAETCDNSGALNGATSASSGSYWNCGGSEGAFHFQLFANGTGNHEITGPFQYDAVDDACTTVPLGDGSYLDVEYSPTLDHLTVYETTVDVKTLIVSECERLDF
jgi:hypothetical protein